MKRVLLLGATGLVGSHCLRYLLEEKAIGLVTVLARKDPGVRHKKLVTEIIDFENLGKYKKRIQGDVLLSAFGTTIKKAGYAKEVFYKWDAGYPLETAEYARNNGCRHFSFVSAAGANQSSPFYYAKVKGEIESRAAEIGFEQLDIFRPSLLLGRRNEKRYAEEISAKFAPMAGFFLKGPMSKYHPVRAEDLARAMLFHALSESPGKRIYHYRDIMTDCEKITPIN